MSLHFPDRTYGDTAGPIMYRALDDATKAYVAWASGTIRILDKSGEVVVDNVAMQVSGVGSDTLSWTPVWGSGPNQIPAPPGDARSVVYYVQIKGIVAAAALDKNTQRSVERTWRIARAI